MEVSRNVFFVGAWKTQNVTDGLLRQISSQMKSKKGYATGLRLTADGLELNIMDESGQVKRQDKILLQNIVDFTENKYSTTCLLAVVKDRQNHYNVFVFLCRSEKDAGHMVQGFAELKKSLSGEGYNFDLTPKGKNWTLKTKDEIRAREGTTVVVTQNGNGYGSYVTSVRNDDTDRSVTSSTSEMRSELHQLAGEVRDIKLMLQQPTSTTVNEYGYRITRPIPMRIEQTKQRSQPTHFEYVKREVKPQIYRNVQPRMRMGSRPKSSLHYTSTASVPGSFRMGYTKRSYESSNPMLERGTTHFKYPPVGTVFADQRVVIPKQSLRKTSSSDIVHKNIEDVYRHRHSSRKYVVPVPVSPKTEIYQTPAPGTVVQEVEVKPETPKIVVDIPPVVAHSSVHHIRYEASPSTSYEKSETTYVTRQNGAEDLSNVSTQVNTSVREDVLLDRGYDQTAEEIVGQETVTEEHDNFIIVRAKNPDQEQSYSQRSYVEEKSHGEGNVIYVGGSAENVNYEDQTNVSGGNVYHVRAEGIDSYRVQSEPDADDIVQRENVTVVQNEPSGLWGAYVNPPDEDEPKDEILVQEAHQYYDRDEDAADEKEDSGNEEGVMNVYDTGDGNDEDAGNDSDNAGSTNGHPQKHVHYMDELEQSIKRRSVSSDNEENGDENNNPEDNEPYVLDEDKLKSYTQEPSLVIVENTMKQGVSEGDRIITNGVQHVSEQNVLF